MANISSIDYFNANKASMKRLFPQLHKIVEKLSVSLQLSHAFNILKKAINLHKKKNKKNTIVLNKLIDKYIDYLFKLEKIHSYDLPDIEKRAIILDDYYKFIEDEDIENSFDSRGKIRSTILEEFTFLYLQDLVNKIILDKCGDQKDIIKFGATKAYSNLYITGADLYGFVEEPLVKINAKDQDYAIYREISISIPDIKDKKKSKVLANVPILAIENKTFLDKTMLEGAAATAEKLKSGNPYSTYIVVAETYAINDDVDPIYSRIDQIFILRKCKHDKDNRLPAPIAADVLQKISEFVKKRLSSTWSDVKNRMETDGIIM